MESIKPNITSILFSNDFTISLICHRSFTDEVPVFLTIIIGPFISSVNIHKSTVFVEVTVVWFIRCPVFVVKRLLTWKPKPVVFIGQIRTTYPELPRIKCT
jgi:hypothetical protein